MPNLWMGEKMRKFETGATRNNEPAFDPEGFMNPRVIRRFCEYMAEHRKEADGELRASDNWQKGIPKNAYMKSLWRHMLDLWDEHRGPYKSKKDQQDIMCAILFNVMGYLYEDLNGR